MLVWSLLLVNLILVICSLIIALCQCSLIIAPCQYAHCQLLWSSSLSISLSLWSFYLSNHAVVTPMPSNAKSLHCQCQTNAQPCQLTTLPLPIPNICQNHCIAKAKPAPNLSYTSAQKPTKALGLDRSRTHPPAPLASTATNISGLLDGSLQHHMDSVLDNNVELQCCLHKQWLGTLGVHKWYMWTSTI